ncbi:glucosylceramide transporter ABCA12 [Brachionichthys hirsutus]|uniref:glucosylceramide transporter ABCA12 n=1 Tax=Brachionichthys hirsutus TaxID=412623 RepID=UPI003604427F
MLAGKANISALLDNVMDIVDAQQCFETRPDPSMCVLELIKRVSSFLINIPALRNETAIISFVSQVVRNAIINAFQLKLPLNDTLANVTMSLQQSNLLTPEINNELRVLEGLINVAFGSLPGNNNFNITTTNPTEAQMVYLKLIDWYLSRVINITSNSTFSELIQPFFLVTQMQVSLQLAQTNFSLFVSNQVEFLLNNLQYPLDGAGLRKIGLSAVDISRQLCELIFFNLRAQNNIPGSMPVFNTTVLRVAEFQVKLYLSSIEMWMKQPSVPLVLTNILQWGNASINISTPLTDTQRLLGTIVQFLSAEELANLYIVGNVTESLRKALMVAEQPGGLQSDQFIDAIVEAVQVSTQSLIESTAPMLLDVQQDITDIVRNSLKLIIQPNMSFASSRNVSIIILQRAEKVLQTILSKRVADFLIPVFRVATSYVEAISTVNGPDWFNQLIFNQLKTIQSLLPANASAQAYLSVASNITQFILDRGNMSVWGSFGNETLDILSLISSQLMMGNIDEDTWVRLRELLSPLLSALEGTELWDCIQSAVTLSEKIITVMGEIKRQENVFIQSLQVPVVTLTRAIAQSANSSYFNISDITERMQLAIQSTVQAVRQGNGTLNCTTVLMIWEPVRQAAGLNSSTMAVWCSIHVQPILEAYSEAIRFYSHLNMSQTHVGPVTANATVARVVSMVHTVFQITINSTRVTQQLVMSFSNEVNVLTGWPLSPEAQLCFTNMIQHILLQNSLTSFQLLTDNLPDLPPTLRVYINATEKALGHILNNSDRLQDRDSSMDVFREAVEIFLAQCFPSSSGNNEHVISGILRVVVKELIDGKAFGDAAVVYEALERFLASNDISLFVERFDEMFAFLTDTNASGLNLLTQLLPKLYNALRPLLSVLVQMFVDIPAPFEVLEDFSENIGGLLTHLLNTGILLPLMETYGLNMHQYEMPYGNNSVMGRYRREALPLPPRTPMDSFEDLFSLDYEEMAIALAVPPKAEDILETVHMFFANPDLRIVFVGVARDLQWGLNASQENTLDAALGIASFLTLPDTTKTSSLHLLADAVNNIPDEFPFFSELKDIASTLASESEENLILMQQTIKTAFGLLRINLRDEEFKENLDLLISQVCALEELPSVRQTLKIFFMEPGELCQIYLPSLQIVVDTLNMDGISVIEAFFETIFGDPKSYDVPSNWTSRLTEEMGLSAKSLNSLNVNITSPGEVAVGQLLKNQTDFILDVQQHMDFDPATLRLLLGTTLPNRNLEILAWLLNLHRCNASDFVDMNAQEVALLRTFCTLSHEQWYIFSVLVARHVNMEKVIYRMVLSEEVQSLVQVLFHAAESTTTMMEEFVPILNDLHSYMETIKELEMINDIQYSARKKKSITSSKSSFVTVSQALCSNGMTALFGISEMDINPQSSPQFPDNQQRQEMIEKFKIPQNTTPFCMNMYLDMVNTTGGAIAWAFLKPLLVGNILYTPDTPVTRAIMEKANATLQEFANLRKNSQEWIESSKYMLDTVELLRQTLPVLQNSLANSFVKNFIEMQTDIDVGKMRETLSNFSNMTVMLDKNKPIMKQITTMSQLMVQLSSCIKFDRYRGYNSPDELNEAAEVLAANRDLYASVIFKLPKSENASTSTSSSSLPPKISYTIRMHMDNVMRTDRVRNHYFIKDSHISASVTLRYNRGFIYLQESIERAIIEIQTGQRVTEPAVQLQPFPYPCHIRDEYLDGISIVFPLVLLMAWMLFVADFVKKLVHERELRLHEYMKMMGVNPLSHFFAWFLECAAFLLVTIFFLTLVLKHGSILPRSDGFVVFLFLCDYGLSILAFSYLISSFFDKTFIAGLSGSLFYIVCFFPFIIFMAVETSLTFSQKNALGLFSPTCFSYASQYVSRYETQGEGIHWSNMYSSPITGDTSSFGWLCWLLLIDSILYFLIGAYIRMVYPGKYGLPAPWYFPFKPSFWADLCCCAKSSSKGHRGLLFNNIMQRSLPVFMDNEGKGQSTFSSQTVEDLSKLRVGVSLHDLTKIYGNRVALQNLNVSFYEGHITSLLGHNGAGKTTTMSLLTGLFSPSFGSIEVYSRDMQTNIDDIRKDLGVCMQYDVLFDHMTSKEHLLLYGQIKAPQWSPGELREQVRTILEETGMYDHRHKRVGALSGGMKRKLSISIAFIGGSRLVVLDEPTTGVDPCSRRNIWDIIIQHKKNCTIIMSTHHLDEAEVLSDRIALLEKGGLKCCGSPLYLKDKLGQGYKLTLTKKTQVADSDQIDTAELKSFVQAHVPEARLKESQGGDLVYSLPPFTSSSASSYRSLLTALDSNLDALQLGGYGISDTTLEEVFLQLIHDDTKEDDEDVLPSISKKVFDTDSIDSFQSDLSESTPKFGDRNKFNSLNTVSGLALAWQQTTAILMKRFLHSRRDWKGLIAEILLPVVFVVLSMGLGSLKSDLRHHPELELSPALYNISPSYSFFSNQNPNSSQLEDIMMSFPGLDNSCLDKSDDKICTTNTNMWISSGNSSKPFNMCKCTPKEQICDEDNFQPPRKKVPSSQIVYNLSGINVESYLAATANDFIRNRYGGFSFGMPLPKDLQIDMLAVPENRTLSKVWFNPEGYHTMPAYLNSLNNFILRSNLPADKDPHEYGISVFTHPYYGRLDDEDVILQGVLHIIVAVCMLTGYSIAIASFAMYEVNEHHSGSKMLQHIAGVSEPLYWVVNFFYDMVLYLIPVLLTVGVIAAFQIPAFTDGQNLGAITLLLVLFGFATFPWMYLLSGVFRDPEMAFISYMCINLFISLNTIMSTSILFFTSQIAIHPEFIKKVFLKLSQSFLIFPQFNFGNGLMTLTRKSIEVQILKGYGVDVYEDPFSLNILGWMFIISFVQGLIFFALRLLLNKSLIRKVRHVLCGRKTVQTASWEDVDEDVVGEHMRVSSGAASSDILQVKQLTKVYQHLKKKTYVVQRLSVGIPAGECFGLLGENGAGKTTTFKMLTGDVSPTEGTAQIRDQDGRLVDIMECRSKGINIGYCPQEDALDNLLTGEEHLYFYGRIRGISERELDWMVKYLLMRLELNYHKNIITDSYSCGTRRKLSTALALIGHPQILLLDEPSSGMDPHTKRHLWKIISEEVKGKCAVVLTSHSMEECEALCSRLAIMVKGQFRCLGSLQHIKNRFGIGFTVKMYLTETSGDTKTITGFMQCRFPSTYLKDQHSAMLEYHVPVAPGGVADIFNQLESNKNSLHIKHFSVSQTTLDEVFINFVRDTLDMDNKSINSEDDHDGWGSIKEVEAMS